VLQQRAAGEAPLHEPPHVSLLILLAPAQANTRVQERLGVRTATQANSRRRQQRPVRALVLAVVQANTRLKDRQRVRRAAHWGLDSDTAQHVTTVPQAHTRL